MRRARERSRLDKVESSLVDFSTSDASGGADGRGQKYDDSGARQGLRRTDQSLPARFPQRMTLCKNAETLGIGEQSKGNVSYENKQEGDR